MENPTFSSGSDAALPSTVALKKALLGTVETGGVWRCKMKRWEIHAEQAQF